MSIYSLNQAERGLWKRIHNNLICFNLVSYSVLFFFFFLSSFLLAQLVQEELCLFYIEGLDPLGSYILALSSSRTKKEWILNTLRKQICGNTLEMVSKKHLFKGNQSFINPAKASESRGVSPGTGICAPSQEGPILPFQSAQEAPGSVRSLYSKAYYAAPWLLPPLCHFWPFHSSLALLPEGRQQGKLKELNHESTIVATAELTHKWLGWKGGGNSCPRWSFWIFWNFKAHPIIVAWKFDSWLYKGQKSSKTQIRQAISKFVLSDSFENLTLGTKRGTEDGEVVGLCTKQSTFF